VKSTDTGSEECGRGADSRPSIVASRLICHHAGIEGRMTMKDLHWLLDQLRSVETEAEWLDFKEAKASFELEKLGQYFSALANEANLKNQA
jgi:hypothetical protein